MFVGIDVAKDHLDHASRPGDGGHSAIRGDLTHDAVASIGDVDVPRFIDGQARGIAETRR